MIFTFFNWYNCFLGIQSNYHFFIDINSGWLEMEFKYLYGDNPTEQQQWEWMFKNAEVIRLSKEDLELFVEMLASPSPPNEALKNAKLLYEDNVNR
jgi:hypothetical protein